MPVVWLVVWQTKSDFRISLHNFQISIFHLAAAKIIFGVFCGASFLFSYLFENLFTLANWQEAAPSLNPFQTQLCPDWSQHDLSELSEVANALNWIFCAKSLTQRMIAHSESLFFKNTHGSSLNTG